MSDRFNELKESVEWMVAYEKGENPPGGRVTKIEGYDVAALRKKMKLSQPQFARVLNVSTDAVRQWEQGRRTASGPAVRLMQIVEKHPEIINEQFAS